MIMRVKESQSPLRQTLDHFLETPQSCLKFLGRIRRRKKIGLTLSIWLTWYAPERKDASCEVRVATLSSPRQRGCKDDPRIED